MSFKRIENHIYLADGTKGDIEIATILDHDIIWNNFLDELPDETSKWLRYGAFYWVVANTDLL